ncbi:hypothetical protein KP509_30G072300 [Ceratopteris richardii]|uniref:Acid phosphatase/vanadium-dependent haloperoxidase-related protein n=1 Tax=Ceratopteris richardii TaxID=49495 RepID=A0A8T2R3U9_CERRI|nr:hypothetical protein KP509_30G072300 [Ceratopteris richardii]
MLSIPEIRQASHSAMTMQYSLLKPGLSEPGYNMRSVCLHRFTSSAQPFRPSLCHNASLSSSAVSEGFQRLWIRRASPSAQAMTYFAVSISHVVSTLAVFLQKKEIEAKAAWSSLLHFCERHVNVLLTESHESSVKNWLYGSCMEQGSLAMALMSTTAIAKDHINPVIATLCANPTFMSGLVAWTVAQVLKVFTTFFVERRWDFKMLLGSGGMPSSHSALCMALTTSVALCHGISDALFPVCLGFSLIVMYDATGVRRHAGMQAEVLNLIVEDLFQGHPISEKKLKELLGHTPLQVGAGAFVGILAGYLCSQGYPIFSGHGV